MITFEAELNEAKSLIADTYKVMQEYYKDDVNEKYKRDILTEIVNKTSLVMMYLIHIRYELLIKIPTSTSSDKIQINTFLTEIKTQLDAFKTLSFNFTTLLNSQRDIDKFQQNLLS